MDTDQPPCSPSKQEVSRGKMVWIRKTPWSSPMKQTLPQKPSGKCNLKLTRFIKQNCMVVNIRGQEDETRKRKGVLWERKRIHVNFNAETAKNNWNRFTVTSSCMGCATSNIKRLTKLKVSGISAPLPCMTLLRCLPCGI